MVGVYIRTEIEGKRTFRKAPATPDSKAEYWLREQNNGHQGFQLDSPIFTPILHLGAGVSNLSAGRLRART
jgi:hypothetical protein